MLIISYFTGQRYAAEIHLVHTLEGTTDKDYKNKNKAEKFDTIFAIAILVEVYNFVPIIFPTFFIMQVFSIYFTYFFLFAIM